MKNIELRSGFTTGTCAAVAAKAATAMLFAKKELHHMMLMTPNGRSADLPLFHVERKPDKVVCAVRKDAGDDPDVTDQALVFASVEYWKEQVEEVRESYCWQNEETGNCSLFLKAGEGIGIVTKPGLSCSVGMPAINPVPRKMIFEGVEEVRYHFGYQGSLCITIWIPKGQELAKKTFNPKLGIEGGLSILGTTGIVKPMSEEALKATIRLELHMKAVTGIHKVILTPGNYGMNFIKETLELSVEDRVVCCSNFIKDALDMAKNEGFKQILFVGHIGKLIKVAGGVSNTHSKYGDHRMEILWDCAVSYSEGKDKDRILHANTTDEAAGILREYGILEPVMKEAVLRIQKYTTLWAGGLPVEVVTFSNQYGILGMSQGVRKLIESFVENQKNNQ